MPSLGMMPLAEASRQFLASADTKRNTYASDVTLIPPNLLQKIHPSPIPPLP